MIVAAGYWKGHRYWIRVNETLGYYCGYAESELKIPAKRRDYPWDFWSKHIDVHQGVTYVEHRLVDVNYKTSSNGTIIGFDCDHSWDARNKSLLNVDGLKLWEIQSPEWHEWNNQQEHWDLHKVKLECYKMIDQIVELEKEENK